MMEAFQQDIDLHKKTVADIFDKPIEEVTAGERDMAKALNFGLLYGMGAKALSSATGLSLAEAKAFIEAYFTTYKNVRAGPQGCARLHAPARTYRQHVRPAAAIPRGQCPNRF